jgi:hypothetical protein
MFIAFAGLAHAVALDGLGQDQVGWPLCFDGGLEGAKILKMSWPPRFSCQTRRRSSRRPVP